MKKLVAGLFAFLLIVTGCNEITHDQSTENLSDWVVYYSYTSVMGGGRVIENEPVAILTLNESLSTYSFHSIKQGVFQGGQYIPFSRDGSDGAFSIDLKDFDLDKISELNCQQLRDLDDQTFIGELTLKPTRSLLQTYKLNPEDWGLKYNIQVRHLSNNEFGLQLNPFMPGMIQDASWTINRKIC